MTFDTFIRKHQPNLSPRVASACRYGLKIMAESHDNMHDAKHVESILDSLDKFMTESREVRWSRINFSILLLAICWHDVWKSNRLPTNRPKVVYHQMLEGIGSMKLFSRETKRFNIDPYVIRKVRYAIRKHSMLQVFPTKNTESRILQDLDKLDSWKPERLHRGFISLKQAGRITPRFANLFKLFFKYRMLPQSRKSHFKWTVKKMDSWKDEFFLEAKDIISELLGPRSAHDFVLLNGQKRKPFIQKVQDYLKRRLQYKIE